MKRTAPSAPGFHVIRPPVMESTRGARSRGARRTGHRPGILGINSHERSQVQWAPLRDITKQGDRFEQQISPHLK